MWRVVIRGLPLGSTLGRRGLGSCTCIFCTIPLVENTHRFNKCPIGHVIWKYLQEIQQELFSCYLMPKQGVFALYVQNCPNNKLGILLQCLHYWGLQHILNMHNGFMFNGKLGVKVHVKKLKINSSNAYSSFLMPSHYVSILA